MSENHTFLIQGANGGSLKFLNFVIEGQIVGFIPPEYKFSNIHFLRELTTFACNLKNK